MKLSVLLFLPVSLSCVSVEVIAQQKTYKALPGPYLSIDKAKLLEKKLVSISKKVIPQIYFEKSKNEEYTSYPTMEGVDKPQKDFLYNKATNDRVIQEREKPSYSKKSYSMFPEIEKKVNLNEKDKQYFLGNKKHDKFPPAPDSYFTMEPFESQQPMNKNFWDVEPDLYEREPVLTQEKNNQYPAY